MKRLLILQNVVLPYRKPVYNGLALDYDVTVLHSGMPTVGLDDIYQEIRVPSRRLGLFYIQNGVFEEVLSRKYDVIIAMFDLRWPMYILPMLMDKQRYEKWILWGHWYSRRFAVNYIRDWLMKRADAILLYGSGEIDRMIHRGIQKHKIFVADNTIHVPNHCDYSNHAKNSLLFVGRLQRRKKIDQLIDAFAHIIDKIPKNVTLEIVGDGGYIYHLLEKVRRLDLEDRIVFHGGIDQHDRLAKLFSRAFAYVSPGHVGLGLLHSFAYGIPVITTSNSEKSERHWTEIEFLKHRVSGFICADENELEEILIEICNSPQLSRTLGKNAYNFYSRCKTLDRMLNGFKQAIES